MSRVRAVKTVQEVNKITEMLQKHCGDIYRQIWELSINTALRVGDILSITMDQAMQGLAYNRIELVESKTGKTNIIELNTKSRAILAERLRAHPDDHWLFQSHSNRAKKDKRPITRQAILEAYKEVGDIVGIKLGTHSGRKTRARLLYDAGTDIAVVSNMLNHATIRDTMIYIDITHDERQQTYHDLVL